MAANSDQRPIVISRPDRIGDVVISTACLKPLREKYPKRPIYFVAAEPLRPLLESHPLLDGFISTSNSITTELTRIDPSTIIHLNPDVDCYRAAYEANVPVRIGYGGPSRFLTHCVIDRRAEGLKHEGEYCYDLLKEIGLSAPTKLRPTIHLAHRDKSLLQTKLPWDLTTTRFAVVGASAYSAKKEWPTPRFIKVAEEIKKEFKLRIVFVGIGTTKAYSDDNLNLSGKTNLGELGWLLKHAQLLVANDTGTGHIAAAVNCPSVIIFGRSDPEYGPTRWQPLADQAIPVVASVKRKRFEATRAFWRRSFASIEVETVIGTVRELLAESTGHPSN